MKKFMTFVGSAVLGSFITLGVSSVIAKKNPGFLSFNSQESPLISQVSYSNSHAMATTDFTLASEKVMPTVVHIQTKTSVRTSAYPPGFEMWEEFFGPGFGMPQQQGIQQGSGSGVIVSRDGYIVTNNHVINNADEITIILHDKREFTAKVIGTDANTDLALLQIDADSLSAITFANSDNTKVGEWVLAVGNPFNLNSTVTAGIVSAKGRNINILKQKYAIESFIQTDAAINPGNSGGALVNTNGDLIGINTAIASPTGAYSGYAFAVPSNIVTKVIYDLKTYGTVQRGFIGVSIKDVDAKLVQEKKLKVYSGAYVESLSEEGAAQTAGIEEGDVIVRIEGIEIEGSSELQEIIARYAPGDKIEVQINRNGKELKLPVTLTNTEGNFSISSATHANVIEKLGVELVPADQKTLDKLGIKQGIIVQEISDGIIAKYTNIRKGFIITKVDNTAIESVEQFVEIMSTKKGGVMIEGMYKDIPGKYYYAFGL